MVLFKKKPSCHNAPDAAPAKGKKVALVGNPNVGKSVLFNALTGAYVTVSNYPGTSVEVARGSATIDGEQYEIIDTPGMYSLLPITEEERVAREILLNESPDVVIHVLDARNLERMLTMTLQLVEAGLPVVLVVNIMDEAERMGLVIDIPLLQEKLGIPVIGAATAKKRGLTEIRKAIALYERGHHAVFGYSRRLEKDIEEIAVLLKGDYILSRKALALLLLQRDDEVAALVQRTEGEGYGAIAALVKGEDLRAPGIVPSRSLHGAEGDRQGVMAGALTIPAERRVTFGERLSRWAVRPVTGVPLLLIVLYFGLYKFVGELRRRDPCRSSGDEGFQGIFQPLDHRRGAEDHPLGGDPGAVRGRVRGDYPGDPLRGRDHPPHRGDLLPLFLDPRRQRLFPPPGAPRGPALQVFRTHRSGGDPDSARFRLRHHGDDGDPHPGNGHGNGSSPRSCWPWRSPVPPSSG